MLIKDIRTITVHEANKLYAERGLIQVVKDGKLVGMSVEKRGE